MALKGHKANQGNYDQPAHSSTLFHTIVIYFEFRNNHFIKLIKQETRTISLSNFYLCTISLIKSNLQRKQQILLLFFFSRGAKSRYLIENLHGSLYEYVQLQLEDGLIFPLFCYACLCHLRVRGIIVHFPPLFQGEKNPFCSKCILFLWKIVGNKYFSLFSYVL